MNDPFPSYQADEGTPKKVPNEAENENLAQNEQPQPQQQQQQSAEDGGIGTPQSGMQAGGVEEVNRGRNLIQYTTQHTSRTAPHDITQHATTHYNSRPLTTLQHTTPFSTSYQRPHTGPHYTQHLQTFHNTRNHTTREGNSAHNAVSPHTIPHHTKHHTTLP